MHTMNTSRVRMGSKGLSLVGVLRRLALDSPGQAAYRLARFGESPDEVMDYGRLDLGARHVAARIQEEQGNIAGERVLISIGFGFEYITAFFGALYAGAMAVPAFPPRQKRMSSGSRRLRQTPSRRSC